MAADDAGRVILEREVVRLQLRAKKREEDAEALGGRPGSVDAPPVAAKEAGDTGIWLPSVYADFYPSDDATPPKQQPASSAGDTPMEEDGGGDDDVAQTSGADVHSDRADIPELVQPGDMEDEDMNVLYEPSSPGQSLGTPKQEGGQAHHEECPDASSPGQSPGTPNQ